MKATNSKKIVIRRIPVIVVTAALVILGFFLIMNYFVPKRNISQTTIDQMILSDDPKILKEQIITMLDRANYCTSAKDCRSMSFGCPFGCVSFVSINFDMNVLQAAMNKYQPNTPDCMYKCARLPVSEEIGCINQKCIDLRWE